MSRPQGRDEIVAAVVAAAATLMTDRGPNAVTLRAVATAAEVTLSQIHRHIGNKDALLAAVLAADVADDTRVRTTDLKLHDYLSAMFRPLGTGRRTKLQARVVLDGYDLPALQSRYPGIDIALELLSERLPDDEARVRAAAFASFLAGWQLLGPTYRQVTGAGDLSPDRVAELLQPVLTALADAPPL